jgi:hypothetical protein
MLKLFDRSEGEAIEVSTFTNRDAVVETAILTEHSYQYLKSEIGAIPDCGDTAIGFEDALEALTYIYARWELTDHDGTIIRNN